MDRGLVHEFLYASSSSCIRCGRGGICENVRRPASTARFFLCAGCRAQVFVCRAAGHTGGRGGRGGVLFIFIKLKLAVAVELSLWDVGNALALSTYPQAGARFAAQQVHTWRREYPSGCDQTGTAPTSTAKSGIGAVPPHGAKHACRGIIPLVLVCVHVRLHPRRTRQRHGSSCARAAGLKYSSAAAATVAKFTVPAPVHKKRVSALSKKPAGAIRQPPPGA